MLARFFKVKIFQQDNPFVIPSVCEESLSVIPNPHRRCEESPTLYQKRFFLLAVVRMTVFRNFFPAAKKLPRKVARWLSVFFCLPLRSLPGAAELAPLRQSSPYFRLLPRSRQPDKGGHFSSPTLPATLRVRAVALCHSERGQQADEESRTICLRFFTTLTLRSE